MKNVVILLLLILLLLAVSWEHHRPTEWKRNFHDSWCIAIISENSYRIRLQVPERDGHCYIKDLDGSYEKAPVRNGQ